MGRWRGLDCSKEKKIRIREKLFKQQNGLCYLCNGPMLLCHKPMSCYPKKYHGDIATFEHIIPRSEGGILGVSNIALSHHRCNTRRANRRVRINLKKNDGCIEYEFINETEVKATYSYYKDRNCHFERFQGTALQFLIWLKYRDL